MKRIFFTGALLFIIYLSGCRSTPEINYNLPSVDTQSFKAPPLPMVKLQYPSLKSMVSPESKKLKYTAALPDFRKQSLGVSNFKSVISGVGMTAKSLKNLTGDENGEISGESISKMKLGNLAGLLGGFMGGATSSIVDFANNAIKSFFDGGKVQAQVLSDRFVINLKQKHPEIKILDRTFDKELESEAGREIEGGGSSIKLRRADYRLFPTITEYDLVLKAVTLPASFREGDLEKYAPAYKNYMVELEKYAAEAQEKWSKYDKAAREILREAREALDKGNLSIRALDDLRSGVENMMRTYNENSSKLKTNAEYYTGLLETQKLLAKSNLFPKTTAGWNSFFFDFDNILKKYPRFKDVFDFEVKSRFGRTWASMASSGVKKSSQTYLIRHVYAEGVVEPSFGGDSRIPAILQIFSLPPDQLRKWRQTQNRKQMIKMARVGMTVRLLNSRTGEFVSVCQISHKDYNLLKAFDALCEKLMEEIFKNSK